MSVNWQLGGVVLAFTFGLRAAHSTELSLGPADPQRLGLLKPLSELVGKKVADSKEHALAKAEDVLLDLSTGHAIAVLVSTKGDARVVVPARTVGYVAKSSIVLRAERKLFESAPRLPRNGPGCGVDEQALAAAAAHFGQPAPDQHGSSISGLVSGATLLNRRLVSTKGECLGQTKELMVDLPVGAVTYAVVEPAGDLAASTQLYVVPPTFLEVTAPGQPLVLKTDRAHFLAGPGFSREFWTDLSFPELAARMREHYGAASRAASLPDAPKVDTAHADSVLAAAVMAEIFNEAKGTIKLNVLVSSRQGKVTLRGSIKDEKMKATVLAAAERVAGAQNVEDLLEIGHKNTTAKL